MVKIANLRIALVVRTNDTNEECYIRFEKPENVAGVVAGINTSKSVHVAESYLADKFGHRVEV